MSIKLLIPEELSSIQTWKSNLAFASILAGLADGVVWCYTTSILLEIDETEEKKLYAHVNLGVKWILCLSVYV